MYFICLTQLEDKAYVNPASDLISVHLYSKNATFYYLLLVGMQNKILNFAF